MKTFSYERGRGHSTKVPMMRHLLLILLIFCPSLCSVCVGEGLVDWDRIPTKMLLGYDVGSQWCRQPLGGPNWVELMPDLLGDAMPPLSYRLPGGGYSGGSSESSPWKGGSRKWFPGQHPGKEHHGVPEPATSAVLGIGIFFLLPCWGKYNRR